MLGISRANIYEKKGDRNSPIQMTPEASHGVKNALRRGERKIVYAWGPDYQTQLPAARKFCQLVFAIGPIDTSAGKNPWNQPISQSETIISDSNKSNYPQLAVCFLYKKGKMFLQFPKFPCKSFPNSFPPPLCLT